jgi:hypothetical protein
MTVNKRALRLAFLGLFPIALIVGVLLEIRNERLIVAHNEGRNGDRVAAIAATREFLKERGVDAAGWQAYCAELANTDLDTYLKANPGAAGKRIREIAPALKISVMLEAPDRERRVFTVVSLDNRVLGYDTHAVSMPAAAADNQPPLQVAEQVIASDAQLASIFGNTKPEVMTLRKTAGTMAGKYTWRSPFPELRDVEMELTVTVRNGHVLSRILNSSVDKATVARLQTNLWLLRIFGICYVTFLCLVAMFSIYSYVSRAIQKEVSHSRTALVALLVAILFFCVLTSGRDEIVLQQRDADRTFPMAFVLVLLALFTAGAGILTGIGYGSGEGDVREAFPGKLTSLDALVTGKIFSRNVGRSIVLGFVIAAWLLLLHALLITMLSPEQSNHSLNALRFPYMATPWLSFLAIGPATVIVFAVAGLLQPLAFLKRFCANPTLRMGLLILFATLAMSSASGAYSSVFGFGIFAIVSVLGLLVPFFQFDLLTAMVALIGFSFVSQLGRITVTLPGWTNFALAMATVALVTLAVETLAWWKGRLYTEEEVRPVYARHIAERQDLQAEVSAAREAQLRLLPHGIPDIPGLSIYASCLPAKVVGGDFYDFFALSDQRLGIFIAEGGNRGLAAALTIALAKGYLMHTARGTYSPTEVILKLEETLGSILDAGVNRTTVAYAVVDPRRRTLRYARTGTYPRIVVTSTGSSSLHEREIPVGEGRNAVREGSIDLKIGDRIFFYTDGIARRIAARSTLPQEDWIRRFGQEAHTDAGTAHQQLLQAINAGSVHERHNLEDDLTAIVIHCSRIDELLIEGAA